ncbi:hypothetical protein KP509_23G023300 [Ceratopteris richardii]|uniref:Calponin-homology (CH) domain-containing protein n=1 Tax=Ceratopteris richardii TaxID=49495 RepID=A0A8T2RZV1_CERRI|nr:hypothetical protein KP509_23G023300 [Ceratopteris richardii]
MEELKPKSNRRCQADLIFTPSIGRAASNQNYTSPTRPAKKIRNCLQPHPSPPIQQRREDESPWQSRRVSAPATEPAKFEKSRHRLLSGQFRSPSKCTTPSKFHRSLNFGAEGLAPRTPSTPSTKCRLPPSANKIRQRAAMRLKALEDERMDMYRHEEDRNTALMESLERAHCAWLNDVLLKPMTENRKAKDSESETSSITSSESRWSSFSDFSHVSSDSNHSMGDKALSHTSSGSLAGRKTSCADKKSFQLGKQAKEGLPVDASLQAICSISVLRSRLDPFMDVKSREEIISTMTKVAKHIDDGRLRMKDGCTILTDVALRENFLQTMLNYNIPWLKIGLYVVLGHNVLVVQEIPECIPEDPDQWDADRETQRAILRLLVEKQFLSHTGLAKYHATNKKIEGLYRQGYHEALARVILKRILLLVLTLDKAKRQSSLPLMCGIDGIDGGSPILFLRNGKIKSSRDALQEFLLGSMHGEGDVIGHLGVLGYHVMHVQVGLLDYSFEVTNLVEDMRDGVRLCRLIQVLLADTSILMKMKIPSDRVRRHSHNCNIALEYLARAGISAVDASGYPISADDLVEGDKERVIGLLCHIVLKLQIPKLINRQRLCQEITRLFSCNMNRSARLADSSLVDLLLLWTQAVCMKFGFSVQDFTSSFADGRALCYIFSYYHPLLLPQDAIQCSEPTLTSTSLLSTQQKACSCKPVELKAVASHNLALFQSAASKIGLVSEMLQISFMEDGPLVCEQSMIIMLAFLYNQLIEGSPKSVESRTAVSWNVSWNLSLELRKDYLATTGCGSREDEFLTGTNDAHPIDGVTQNIAKDQQIRNQAAAVIQSAVRIWLKSIHVKTRHRNTTASSQEHVQEWSLMHSAVPLASEPFYKGLSREQACLIIQRAWRMHSNRKLKQLDQSNRLFSACKIQAWWRKCMVRQDFIVMKANSVRIQRYFRFHRETRRYRNFKESVVKVQALIRGISARRQYCRYKQAAVIIQSHWRLVLHRRSCFRQKQEAALKIQAYWQGFTERRSYLRKKAATILLQRSWKTLLASRFLMNKWHVSAITLQSQWRRYISRKNFLMVRDAAILIQTNWKEFRTRTIAKEKEQAAVLMIQYHWIKYRQVKHAAVLKIQSHWRKFREMRSYARKRALIITLQRNWRDIRTSRLYLNRLVVSAIRIQSHWRRSRSRKSFLFKRDRAILIQRKWREFTASREKAAALMIQIQWKKFREEKKYARTKLAVVLIQSSVRGYLSRKKYVDFKMAIIKLQALFRGTRVRKTFNSLVRSVELIQSYWRKYLTRRERKQEYEKLQNAAIKLQSSWRRFSARRTFLAQQIAMIRIQSFVRGYLCRVQYCILKQNVTRMQAFIRRRIARAEYTKMKESAIKIQALYRGRIHHRRFNAYREAVRRIQAFTMGRRERLWFNMCKSSATLIQKHFRKHLYRRRLLRVGQLFSAMKIQYAWRYMRERKAAVLIQAHYRGWKQKRLYLLQINNRSMRALGEGANLTSSDQVHTEGLYMAVLMLQRWWRKRLNERRNAAATTIQKHVRCWLANRAFKSARRRIIHVQALWRGFQTRHKRDDLKEEFSDLRQRMQSTAANVDKKMRLEYRLTEALAALLSQKTVSGILHTCATIGRLLNEYGNRFLKLHHGFSLFVFLVRFGNSTFQIML